MVANFLCTEEEGFNSHALHVKIIIAEEEYQYFEVGLSNGHVVVCSGIESHTSEAEQFIALVPRMLVRPEEIVWVRPLRSDVYAKDFFEFEKRRKSTYKIY